MTTEPQNPPAILKKVDTIEKLEAFLKKKKKSSKDHSNYDILFRYFINKNTPEDQLDHLLEIFLPKLDGNFQSQSNGNTTPMMHLVGEGLNSLCEQLIEKIGESLDLTLKDNEQENIFFKIINSSNDNRKVNLFKMALTLLKEDSEEEEKKETLDVINSSGKSLIESALNIGNSDISSMLLMEGIDPKIKNEVTGDNLLHFAIRGKNPFCLKMVLNTVEQDSIYEFIKETNKDNETPIQLANKLNISTIVKQLNDFISGEKKSKISGENNEDEIYDLLSQLTEDNTDKIVSTISKNYYVSDWNKLFLEIIKKNQSNQKYDPELNKKINDYFNFNKELDEIDENMEKKDNNKDEDKKEDEKDEIKFPICLNMKENQKSNKYDPKNNIHFLNYIVGAEHSGNFQNMLNVFKSYIENYKAENQNVNNYIFYVNTIIILIEKCLKQNLIDFANILIINLNQFLQNNNIDTQSFDFKNSNSTQFLKYLSTNEVINPTTDLKGLTILYQCNLNLIKGNFEKAQENLGEFKSIFYGSEKEKKNKNNEPIHKTMENLYHFLKVKVDYFLNVQFKLNKHLSAIDKYKTSNDSILFYYNFLGIINMKQGHYSYAEYCFKYCRNIICQNSMLYLKYLDGVEYNLALCYFFTKDYDKSIEILNKIKNLESMKNNPYLFYRLALSYIEKEFLKHKINFKRNNENDIVSKTIFNDNNDEPAFKKRFLLVNQSPSPSIINPPTDGEDDDENSNNSIDNLDFSEAIRALKECILIINGYNSYHAQIYETLKPLINNELIDLKPLFNNDENQEKNFADDSNFQYNDIYELAYLNLIFCLIRNENYAESIEIIEEFREKNPNLNKYRFVLDNYSIEAYLKLGEFDKALNILSKENFSYENIDAKGAFFSNSNNQVYNEVTYRLALYINLIKINILNNNAQDAEKYINSILSLLNYPTEKELPPYVINIIIFYFLSIGKNEQAVQIIKYRRIPKFYSN
jgi:hypothetical protein